MPLSLQIQALFAIEIIKEFRGYGLNLVAQERRTGAYNGAAAREFHSLYNLDEAAAIIWVSEPLFANIVNTERLAGRNMDLCPATGWIYFPGAPNVQDTGTTGSMMAARLRAGQAVTLTAMTAPHLNAAFKAVPPAYCTWPLRTALWIGTHYVLWTKRPLMIELRHRNRAQLWHLRGKSVAAYFASRPCLGI
ncbi:MAG: hypothetical protein Q7V17_20930 [Afipia sp.]|nr:hypothetical protein [Afipia sp.]